MPIGHNVAEVGARLLVLFDSFLEEGLMFFSEWPWESCDLAVSCAPEQLSNSGANK
jgi:hypothetical protein